MRIIVMYDLDMSTPELQKQYTHFHKWLVQKGYFMMQYSIYMKPINAMTKRDYEINALKVKLPHNGNIRVLTVTESQYQNMVFLRGGKRINESINTSQRRIKINYED